MMSDDEKADRDWEDYLDARQRNEDYHGEYIRTYSARAYEYGVLAIKNFTLISGGALLAIPAVASMAGELPNSAITKSGLCFTIALIASLIATYATHFNWSLHYDLRELFRENDSQELRRKYLQQGELSDAEQIDKKKKISALQRKIWWSWIVPHCSGLFGFGAFLSGCWQLYGGLNLIG